MYVVANVRFLSDLLNRPFSMHLCEYRNSATVHIQYIFIVIFKWGQQDLNSMQAGPQIRVCTIGERSGSVVECLTQDRGAGGSSRTGVTVLWSLSKTHLS